MPQVNVPIIPGAVSSVAAGVTPAKVDAYKPAEILQMMSSAQEYQKAKELMPYAIESGKAQAQQQVTAAKKADIELQQHNMNISRGVFGGLLSDPDFINGNTEGMVKKLNASKEYLTSIGVTPPDGGKMFNTLIEEARTNPAAAYQTIKNGVQQAGGAAAQYTTQQQYQPPQVYQYGGAQQPPGSQPTGVTPDQMGRPASEQQQPQGMRLTFQPRQAGDVRPVAPGEAEEAALGQKYVAGLNDYGINTVKYKNDVNEVIKQAEKIQKEATFTSGLAGAGYRRLQTALGDASYIQLQKDLANVTLASLKASGSSMSTDAGKTLESMANGNETYPPEVLINIANRAKADITNTDMQRQAANKFNQRYPGYANFGVFKQAWADNADATVFQMINAEKEIKDEAKRKKAFTEIMGLPSDPSKYTDEQKAKAAELMTKYRNIKKLVGTGVL